MHDILIFLQQHILLTATAVVVLIALLIIELLKAKNSAGRLPPSAAVQMINHQNATIVDIRPYEAFLNNHIIDAISLPSNDLSASHPKIAKLKLQPILLVCATGVDSAREATKLKKDGLDAYAIEGGMRAWSEAELPVIKG